MKPIPEIATYQRHISLQVILKAEHNMNHIKIWAYGFSQSKSCSNFFLIHLLKAFLVSKEKKKWKQKNGKNDCWVKCGREGGLCERVCGVHGFCCRKNYDNYEHTPECPNSASEAATERHHTCMIKDTEGDFKVWNSWGTYAFVSRPSWWSLSDPIFNLSKYEI